MTTKTPHIHADFLIEAAQDMRRKIEGKHINGDFWEEVTFSFVAEATRLWKFRFADTVRNRIVSSLSDGELYAIVSRHNPDNEDVNYSIIRAVANASAQRQEADTNKNFGFKHARTSNNIV
jgi:hypothetical protein